MPTNFDHIISDTSWRNTSGDYFLRSCFRCNDEYTAIGTSREPKDLQTNLLALPDHHDFLSLDGL